MTEAVTISTPLNTPIDDARVVRAIQLIWREADLLDRKDYITWNELYADEGIYVIPVDSETDDFDNNLNMVYDDARMRALRVQRLVEGYAISAVDSARTVRTVSRFVPGEVSEDIVSLRAGQVLVAHKRGNYDLWAADVDYVIRLGQTPVDDRIVRKAIRLIDAGDVVPAAGFLL
ncbi:aromatic-ring-hydroxylating dioxygenase subunit beta [Pseudarthrobacter sp. B4EP4b]|jgi:3-phenylpropionate/cinnamic acid dioxygenase small subunit|uniref:aromatic-ring-hydroxylating dioxygenase subunit beta n=1 Tax=unclassified Pseudarthrobacter TaxID=2647000 RepID=UPI00114E7E51|nr:aromatic-ring-hydroxylating dioxygenase subunit beta [Pseudarthrobacter sp. B4EP4b]